MKDGAFALSLPLQSPGRIFSFPLHFTPHPQQQGLNYCSASKEIIAKACNTIWSATNSSRNTITWNHDLKPCSIQISLLDHNRILLWENISYWRATQMTLKWNKRKSLQINLDTSDRKWWSKCWRNTFSTHEGDSQRWNPHYTIFYKPLFLTRNKSLSLHKAEWNEKINTHSPLKCKKSLSLQDLLHPSQRC